MEFTKSRKNRSKQQQKSSFDTAALSSDKVLLCWYPNTFGVSGTETGNSDVLSIEGVHGTKGLP